MCLYMLQDLSKLHAYLIWNWKIWAIVLEARFLAYEQSLCIFKQMANLCIFKQMAETFYINVFYG